MNARKRLAIVVGLVMGLGVMGTALAEGSWSSFVSGARVGFYSRIWTDKNLDNVSTSVKFSNCRDSIQFNQDNVTVAVRESVWGPDPWLASKTLICVNSDTGFWGDLAASNYYFQITKIGGLTGTEHTIDANVAVNY